MMLRDIKSQEKLLENQEVECKNHLMSIVGCAEKAVGNSFSITWKAPKDKEVFNLKKFKIDHPKLVKQYIKPEPQTRRFTVSFPRRLYNMGLLKNDNYNTGNGEHIIEYVCHKR